MQSILYCLKARARPWVLVSDRLGDGISCRRVPIGFSPTGLAGFSFHQEAQRMPRWMGRGDPGRLPCAHV